MDPSRRVSTPRSFARALRFFVCSSILLAGAQGASATWLDDQIVWIQNRLNQTYSRANTAASQASSAATQALVAAQNTNGLKDVVTRIQEAYGSLDGPAISLMEKLIEFISALLLEQQKGFETFTTSTLR